MLLTNTALARRPGLRLLLIVLAIGIVFGPGLRSFLFVDDYFLFAVSRLVDEPFSAFVHSHFPMGSYYRPLAMAFWWGSVELFGTSAYAHCIINLALQVGVTLALWRLLSRWTHATGAVVFATLVFAIHPIAIGTSLWFADRFDLLATFFGLLAIDCARSYRMRAEPRALILTFGLATCAVLSKETGFAVFVPIIAIWIWPRWDVADTVQSRFWNTSRYAALALIALAIALLGWRTWVLGATVHPALLNGKPIAQIVFEGACRWVALFALYLMQLPRLDRVAQVCVGIGVACLLLHLALKLMLTVVRQRASIVRNEFVLMAVAALGLLLATAILQAPTLRATPVDLDPKLLGVWVATNSRFFYCSLTGLAMLAVALCSLAEPATRVQGKRRKFEVAFAVVAAALCIVPWSLASHQLSRTYTRESRELGVLVKTAQATVARLPLPADRCQVYFLDVPADRVFLFTVVIDSAIKVLTPDIARVQGCLFQTETTPWAHIVKRGSVTAESAAPMRRMYLGDQVAPWSAYGGVEYVYLNLLDGTDPRTMHSAIFLAYDQGDFLDVTADVLAGRRDVKFRCMREKEQCVGSSQAMLSKPPAN